MHKHRASHTSACQLQLPWLHAETAFQNHRPWSRQTCVRKLFYSLANSKTRHCFRQTLEHLSPKFLGSWRMTGNPLHFRPVRYMPMQPGIVRHLLRIAANKQTLEQLIGS